MCRGRVESVRGRATERPETPKTTKIGQTNSQKWVWVVWGKIGQIQENMCF